MPTISLRVSEDLKKQLDDLARERNTTLSGIIVEALNSVTGVVHDGRSEGADCPGTINSVDRLILHNTELLLANCRGIDDDARDWHRYNAEVLRRGYAAEYPTVFCMVFREMPYQRWKELLDILDMFRVLRSSYEKLTEEEKGEIDEESISYRGFSVDDDEKDYLHCTWFLFSEEDRYAELEGPLERFASSGRSRRSLIGPYRMMLQCFSEIWREHIVGSEPLSLEEMKRIAAAASEPAR